MELKLLFHLSSLKIVRAAGRCIQAYPRLIEASGIICRLKSIASGLRTTSSRKTLTSDASDFTD
jgi:hypothetical protein